MKISRREALVAAALIPYALQHTSGSVRAEDVMVPIQEIKSLDYTVIFTRDMKKMKEFYETIMRFPIVRELGENAWVEFQVGSNILTLTPAPAGGMFKEKIPEAGVASLQLAFRVTPKNVDNCARYLKENKVPIISEPTDQQWGHRTLFFRDPDNNILEIYAEI